MGSKSSKVVDDSKSVSNAPPPYSTTSESTPARFRNTICTVKFEEIPIVQSGDGLGENHFVAHFRIRKFQKRIRIARDVSVEFVAGGRIWSLKIPMKSNGKCHIGFNLSQHSFPVYPICVIVIEAHEKPGCATPSPALQFINSTPDILVPHGIKYDGGKDLVRINYCWEMSTDWVMDELRWYPARKAGDDIKIVLVG
ncbi:hypothetical protein DFJ58DRAFT_848405 [Suillus subalutaceus]|uniref:uncharacterized protein n=1 Tax=Suillus subalutaceus TaxID=48586 RepID=UPI001B876478|nr:uncharacterized protein DFJ58DRAFT_848405 [Suillus subalutaceus]KAG1830698.1 hypothetical protein DFJ58DRAFT_848405 [Suillus subalutaceus]